MAKVAKVTTLKDFQKLEAVFSADAARLGLADDYVFMSTLDRYRVQVNLLERLQAEIDGNPSTIEKTYTSGQPNLYAHPALSEFVKVCGAADRTAALLHKLKAAAEKSAADSFEDDEL